MSTATIPTKADYFVATNGNDTNPGTIEVPFATLARARDAVRELKKAAGEKGLRHPVTVWVRGGKYYIDRCLDLTEADSGTAQAPIVYSAYPGETPVLSGGKRITNWKPYRDGIYRSKIPETKGSGLFFRQLYADGQRQVRSRYPKLDPQADNWNGRWARSRVDDAALQSSEPYIVWDEPDAFRHPWAKPTQGELFLMPRQTMWGDSCMIRIKSVDPKKGVIQLVHGMRDFDVSPMFFHRRNIHPEFCQFIVENLLEELTAPGEWCLDTEEGLLYFWPPKDRLENLEVVIPVLKRLVYMEGVSHVCLSGFVVTEVNGGEPSSHYPDVEGVGAMTPQMGWEYCGEAIYMNRCTGCCIEHNRISNVGGNGVYLRHHNERNRVRHNEISCAGANGIVLAGGRRGIYGDCGGAQGISHPVFNEITDNTIHHIGLLDTYAAGVFLGLSNWNRVAHNHIHDVPHHAVNLGNSRFGRNYVEYNRIHRAGTITHDNGAINCWHETPLEVEPPGHVIRYNFISDTGNADKEGVGYTATFGIYLDNRSSNCLVQGNVIVNTLPHGNGYGICIKGRNNIIENNIVVNAGLNHVIVLAHACYPEFAAVVLRNIFFDTTGSRNAFLDLPEELSLFKVMLQCEEPRTAGSPETVMAIPLCKVLSQCDGNLYFKQGNDNPAIIQKSARVLGSRPFPNGFHAEEPRFDTVLIHENGEGARTSPDSSSRQLGVVPAIAVKGDFPTAEEWARGLSLPGLVTRKGTPAEPGEVEARLLRDDKYLYLRARCCGNKRHHETDASIDIWSAERVELFLRPLLSNQPFLQLAVACNGRVYRALCNAGAEAAKSISWNAEARQLSEEEWEAVMRVAIEDVERVCGGSTPAWGLFLGACLDPRHVSFAEWQGTDGWGEEGYDANARAVDPLFVDAANGDYRLRPESPALKLGFQPIPFDRIGVRRRL